MFAYKYKSKKNIDTALSQAKYLYYKKILKFKGKIFVNAGIDKEFNCSPLNIYFSAFITNCRSVFQYVIKEIKQNNRECNHRVLYDEYIKKRPLIKLFKTLRDIDIHAAPGGNFASFNWEIKLSPQSESTPKKEPKKLQSKDIKYKIIKYISPDKDIYEAFKKENRLDLIEAIENGEQLYEEVVFENDRDMFSLCNKYLEEVETFIKYCLANHMIS